MATLEIGIPERSKSRLFIVGGREDLLKLVFTVLIIVGFVTHRNGSSSGALA